MPLSRLLLPLLFALSLVFAQQEGAAHALTHALDPQQQEKHAPDSPPCEKCQHYAELGNALQAGTQAFVPPIAAADTFLYAGNTSRPALTFRLAARAPPALSLKTA